MNVWQNIQRTMGDVQYLVHKTMVDKHDSKKQQQQQKKILFYNHIEKSWENMLWISLPASLDRVKQLVLSFQHNYPVLLTAKKKIVRAEYVPEIPQKHQSEERRLDRCYYALDFGHSMELTEVDTESISIMLGLHWVTTRNHEYEWFFVHCKTISCEKKSCSISRRVICQLPAGSDQLPESPQYVCSCVRNCVRKNGT